MKNVIAYREVMFGRKSSLAYNWKAQFLQAVFFCCGEATAIHLNSLTYEQCSAVSLLKRAHETKLLNTNEGENGPFTQKAESYRFFRLQTRCTMTAVLLGKSEQHTHNSNKKEWHTESRGRREL